MKAEGFSSTLAIRDNQGALCIVYDNKGTLDIGGYAMGPLRITNHNTDCRQIIPQIISL